MGHCLLSNRWNYFCLSFFEHLQAFGWDMGLGHQLNFFLLRAGHHHGMGWLVLIYIALHD